MNRNYCVFKSVGKIYFAEISRKPQKLFIIEAPTIYINTAINIDLLAYDPCTVRGWWKLASPFFSNAGVGLKLDLSSSVRIF